LINQSLQTFISFIYLVSYVYSYAYENNPALGGGKNKRSEKAAHVRTDGVSGAGGIKGGGSASFPKPPLDDTDLTTP
jgi:hypothetical protein